MESLAHTGLINCNYTDITFSDNSVLEGQAAQVN